MHNDSIFDREIADRDRTGEMLGRGLGLFSVGLGLAELFAPRGVARFIGVDHRGAVPLTVRALGVREIAASVGLLARPTFPFGPWSRVVGDLIDLALLGVALGTRSVDRSRTIGAIAAVAGVTAVDTYAGIRQSRRQLGEPVTRAITIHRPPQEVYAVFRDLQRLPQFMTWVESVRDLGGNMTHWKVRTPAGMVEYDAELIEDVPGRRIAWRSVEGATIPNRGCVTFLEAPGGRGTEVIVELQVSAPLGKTIAGAESQNDLHRLKQVLETGEVVHSDASIHRGMHPAQPSAPQGGGQ